MSTTASKQGASSPADKSQKIPRRCLPGIPIRVGAFLCIFAMLAQLCVSLAARLIVAPNNSGFPFDLLFGGGAFLAYLGLAWAAWTRNAKMYPTLHWTGTLMYIVAVVVLINPSMRLLLESSQPNNKGVGQDLVYALLIAVNLLTLYMCNKYSVVLNHEAKAKEGSVEGRV